MTYDPWYKTTLKTAALKLHVPHDVFSTLRIDEGTRLLLDYLPAKKPHSVLDMGCGYGALGLPVAASFPDAQVDMADRDLLAVTWANRNAEANQLTNARAKGSLGFREIVAERRSYDWILCNVPARIGRPFIMHLLETGQKFLQEQGELRIVVIRDLAPLIDEIRTERGLPLTECARGPRHVVFSLLAAGQTPPPCADDTSDELYLRDTVEVGGLRLDRPFDLGGDDPRRLSSGLPVLLDALPRSSPRRILCFRCGYGALPLIARKRWPEATVTCVDRDLLATTFTRRNAMKLGLAGDRLEIREAADFPAMLPDVLPNVPPIELVLGELSPSAGGKVAMHELTAISKMLSAGNPSPGEALILMHEKNEREWINPLLDRGGLSINRVIAREGYVLLRMTGQARANNAKKYK